jgi:ferric-dicitrate binding protein FerR (iron transport regulator)
MAVIVPGVMLAANMNSGMMYTSGPVLVNGAGVSRAATIFAGDRLQVPAQSAATITVKGSSVTVAPGSAITFGGDTIALEARSAVSISTTEGMAAQVRKLTIAPAAKSETKFQVVRLNGNVVISAKLGAVEIAYSTASKKTVEEGETATVPDPDPQTQPPVVGGGANVPSWVPPVAFVASAGTAIGTAMATTTEPVSPVHP